LIKGNPGLLTGGTPGGCLKSALPAIIGLLLNYEYIYSVKRYYREKQMRVEVRNNNVDKALKILKKKMFDDGIIKDVMERRYFVKPSAKRRKRKLEAVNRDQKRHERERQERELHKLKARRR
jgi:small subunit ribosomal protein S21